MSYPCIGCWKSKCCSVLLFHSTLTHAWWKLVRMFTIFYNKYNNLFSKIVQYGLCNWLHLWFKPFRKSAGCQQGQRWIELIVTLKLIDPSRRKQLALFIAFIDLICAYDSVPWAVLFSIITSLVCGAVVLAALVAGRLLSASYRTTIVTATIGLGVVTYWW